MTAVLVAWLVSSLPLGILVGRRLAGRPVVPSPRARVAIAWALALAGCFALAWATRGQVVTWHGVIEAQP